MAERLEARAGSIRMREETDREEARLQELISADRIQHRVAELAEEINEDLGSVDLLYLVIVLRGGCFFGVDLARRLRMPVRLDYIRVQSYQGTSSTGIVSLVSDISGDVSDKPVLIIDDIVDTGFTMHWILSYLQLKKPAAVRVAALLDKPSRREFEVPIDYLGFRVPNVFVAGYGLDGTDDTMANMPKIVSLDETQEEAVVPPERVMLPGVEARTD